MKRLRIIMTIEYDVTPDKGCVCDESLAEEVAAESLCGIPGIGESDRCGFISDGYSWKTKWVTDGT